MSIYNILYSFLFLLLFSSCTESAKKQEAENTTLKKDTGTAPKALPVDTIESNELAEEYATYSILIVDTGKDYALLDHKMIQLSKQLNLPIDTMGRYFNKKKNRIVLPENDDDEIYAGEYFPRRFPSENLSLEYLVQYQETARENTIALVSGIYEKQQDADSALFVLRKFEPKSFKVQSRVYIGCMH